MLGKSDVATKTPTEAAEKKMAILVRGDDRLICRARRRALEHTGVTNPYEYKIQIGRVLYPGTWALL